MNLQDRFYGSQISGVGKKFITAVSDENLLEAKEAVETGLFGKAGEFLSEEASLQTIADRIISGDVAERLEEASKKSETKKSSKEEGWGEDEEEEDEEMEEAMGASAVGAKGGKVGKGGKSVPSLTSADKAAISKVGDKIGGKVKDGMSLAGFMNAWGTDSKVYDFNGDGTVDGLDLGEFLSMMGESTEQDTETINENMMDMMKMLFSMMAGGGQGGMGGQPQSQDPYKRQHREFLNAIGKLMNGGQGGYAGPAGGGGQGGGQGGGPRGGNGMGMGGGRR